jgi:hypothetical protein
MDKSDIIGISAILGVGLLVYFTTRKTKTEPTGNIDYLGNMDEDLASAISELGGSIGIDDNYINDTIGKIVDSGEMEDVQAAQTVVGAIGVTRMFQLYSKRVQECEAQRINPHTDPQAIKLYAEARLAQEQADMDTTIRSGRTPAPLQIAHLELAKKNWELVLADNARISPVTGEICTVDEYNKWASEQPPTTVDNMPETVEDKSGWYHCGHCGEQFRTGNELNHHRKDKHPELYSGAVFCPMCDEFIFIDSTQGKHNYAQHMLFYHQVVV